MPKSGTCYEPKGGNSGKTPGELREPTPASPGSGGGGNKTHTMTKFPNKGGKK